MQEVIKLFKNIQNTSSTKEKQRIISENKDNELFKECLIFLLDSNIVTGISDKKFKKITDASTYKNIDGKLNTFEDVMEYLKVHNTGTDADIAKVKSFVYDHYIADDDEFNFYVQMITKKYKLGADAKLVNKAIPGLIPTFNVMLGTSIDKCKLKGNEWISLSKKLNGCRCAFLGDKCMTRQGKEYVGLDHIINDLKFMGYSDYFIDGELLYKNNENLSDSEAFQKGTGIAMSKDADKSQLKLVVFDIFPLEEFLNGSSKETYFHRKRELQLLQLNIDNHLCKNIEVVPMLYEGTDQSKIWKWLDYAEDNDWEGIVCNLDTCYECKRTKNLIKIKKFYTYDLKIIDIEEGSGRNKNTLGSLVVEYKNNIVKVGSGFSDEERKEFWENKLKYIGRIIEVKYKEKTKDKKTGLESLQFPVYVRLREHGKTVSYN